MKQNTYVLASRVALFALLALPLVASARIGETLAQCDARYGGPGKLLKDGHHLYTKPPMQVICRFNSGICESIVLCHTDLNGLNRPTEMSKVEIDALLEVNSAGRTWEKRQMFSMNDEWKTGDDFLYATYTSMDHYLVIMTKAEMDKNAASQAAQEKEKLKGF